MRWLMAATVVLAGVAMAQETPRYDVLLRSEGNFIRIDCDNVVPEDNLVDGMACYAVSGNMELARLYLERAALSTTAEWVTTWRRSEVGIESRIFAWQDNFHSAMVAPTDGGPTVILFPDDGG